MPSTLECLQRVASAKGRHRLVCRRHTAGVLASPSPMMTIPNLLYLALNHRALVRAPQLFLGYPSNTYSLHHLCETSGCCAHDLIPQTSLAICVHRQSAESLGGMCDVRSGMRQSGSAKVDAAVCNMDYIPMSTRNRRGF